MKKRPKSKSNNLIDTFFNVILIIKPYRFETALPIETVIENLQSMSGGWQIGLREWQIRMRIEQVYDQYAVNIDGCYSPSSALIGSTMTVFSEADGKSIIVGEVHLSKLSALFLFVSLIIAAYIIVSGPPSEDIGRHLLSFLLFSSVPIYYLVHLLVVRNKLLGRIQTTTVSPHPHVLEQSQSTENRMDLYSNEAETQTQVQ